MEVKYRLLLLVYTAFLVFSLFRIVQYLRGHAHFLGGPYVYLAVAAGCLAQLSRPIQLSALRLLERTSLVFVERNTAKNPLNPNLYMMKGVTLLRLTLYRLKQAMHMLAWIGTRSHSREIQARITRELVGVTQALASFNLSFCLDITATLTRGGGVFSHARLNPRRPQLAQAVLSRLNEIVPGQIDETPPDERGPVLLQALCQLVNVLALDPLSLAAYARAHSLMLYLRREDIAEAFDMVAMHLAHPPAEFAQHG